jgi:uncharacterized secreted repeat protein (TIGR03808 family)
VSHSPTRRSLLLAGAGLSAAAPAAADAPAFDLSLLRGGLDASGFGVSPGGENASRAFARMLGEAARGDMPVFLPPGSYRVADLELPARVRLHGVPGATRIVFAGGRSLFLGENLERFELCGVTLDGAGLPLGEGVGGLCDLRGVAALSIDGCTVEASAGHGVALRAAGGRIERSTIRDAADAGIYSEDGAGLAVTGNRIAGCGNGGILVHRQRPGEDNTLVCANRVERIGATFGGTGQHGNGINVFQADNVVVSGNHVADCAFSAIRSNAGGNVQIAGNTCLRSGEVAIYSEFGFQGAVIGGNVVDGAATGISVANFNEGGRLAVVSGNLVRNLRREGPYAADPPGFGEGIYVEADAVVTGNVVENAPLYGLSIGWGPFMRDVVATGNVVRKARFGIAVTVVEGAGAALIADNVIAGSREAAVVGHRWAEIATGDLAREPDGRFAHLTVERNRVS